jgi:hypothetical protein
MTVASVWPMPGTLVNKRLAIKANVAVIATLQSQIELLEKRLQERVKPRPGFCLRFRVQRRLQFLNTLRS